MGRFSDGTDDFTAAIRIDETVAEAWKVSSSSSSSSTAVVVVLLLLVAVVLVAAVV